MFRVLSTGPQMLLQDRGRPGLGHLGVASSGAFDRMSAARANHAVGNSPDAPVLEILVGGAEIATTDSAHVILTGMRTTITVTGGDGTQRTYYSNTIIDLEPDDSLQIHPADSGLRGYLAVRGGFDAQPVLGSVATDVMSALGSAPVHRGDLLAVGSQIDDMAWWPLLRELPTLWHSTAIHELDVIAGPRSDWFTDEALTNFSSQTYTVRSDSNRIGIRLDGGAPLTRSREDELASEGTVRGAIQVPPNGMPIIFGPDHPVTGGYPVIGVLSSRSSDHSAQLAPGDHVRFRIRNVS